MESPRVTQETWPLSQNVTPDLITSHPQLVLNWVPKGEVGSMALL